MGTLIGSFQGVGMLPLLYLFAGHALCDYPLQGQFLSDLKNHRNPLPGMAWQHGLIAHSLIHAGMVAWITGSFTIGMCEFTIHLLVDWSKCEGKLNCNQDQLIHYGCKVAWWICMML